jgi:hypothetical protein
MKPLRIAGIIFILLISIGTRQPLFATENNSPPVNARYLGLSEQLLYQVKTNAPTDSLERILAQLQLQELAYGLSDDKARKTFWINIYNAYFQLLATRDHKTRPAIFTGNFITLAGTLFSLDDIEHGILRHYRNKLSQGYRAQSNPGNIIKQLAVENIDYRIHFALNCGAKSCPPIAFYKYERLDEQLDLAAASFLSSETQINDNTKTVTTSKILFFYKGDFGGDAGILKVLTKYLNQNLTGYKLKFNPYNWDAKLKNFNQSQ